jgi:hypothetical protein
LKQVAHIGLLRIVRKARYDWLPNDIAHLMPACKVRELRYPPPARPEKGGLPSIDGRMLLRRVALRDRRKPLAQAQCHCRECQHITGGSTNMFVAMPPDLPILNGENIRSPCIFGGATSAATATEVGT